MPPPRRRLLMRALACAGLVPALPGCVARSAKGRDDPTTVDLPALADRLPLYGTLLLGEVHDNVAGHAARLAVLQRLPNRAQPTVVVLEHIDQRHQRVLDDARASHPDAPQRWVDAVLAAGGSPSWPWMQLLPALAVAARAGWPVRGANRTRAELESGLADGPVALGAPALQRLRQAIEDGHCNVLPPSAVTRLVALQQARDRAMVAALRAALASAPRVVLLAGNGHVRRDFGAAADPALRAAGAVVSIGFVEPDDSTPADAFDHRVVVAPQPRPDPCASLRERKPG